MGYWNGKKVLITGGAGFIGSHTAEILLAKNAEVSVIDTLENGNLNNLNSIVNDIEILKKDLRDFDSCVKASKNKDVVMNIAAMVGGIHFNEKHPALMLHENILINTNVLNAAKETNVERFLVVSSACVYPRNCSIPTPEEEGFKDHPEPTNFGYGWAKRIAEIQGMAYNKEYGMNVAIARPYNCYGPRDQFDPEKSHMIPAIIKRIFDNENPLVVWGSGEQSRSFIYVTDLAKGLVEVTEKYATADPVNLGSNEEIKIKDLVELIKKISGKSPSLKFDNTKPDGQPRRKCDDEKAIKILGFKTEISLKDGIKNMIEWYKQNILND